MQLLHSALLTIMTAALSTAAPTDNVVARQDISIELANVQGFSNRVCDGDFTAVPIDGPAGQCDLLFPEETIQSVLVTSVSRRGCAVEIFTDTNCISIDNAGREFAPVGFCVALDFPVRGARVVCPGKFE